MHTLRGICGCTQPAWADWTTAGGLWFLFFIHYFIHFSIGTYLYLFTRYNVMFWFNKCIHWVVINWGELAQLSLNFILFKFYHFCMMSIFKFFSSILRYNAILLITFILLCHWTPELIPPPITEWHCISDCLLSLCLLSYVPQFTVTTLLFSTTVRTTEEEDSLEKGAIKHGKPPIKSCNLRQSCKAWEIAH
jgi:hypothetical protein